MKHITTAFAAALAAVLIPFSVVASDTSEPELQLVNATGYGTTVKEASLAAIRAAVESVVGTLVDAETLVENDDLIQNQILTYSTGLVESAEHIGSPTKTESGLYQVRIRAKVKKTAIADRIKGVTSSESSIAGESLYLQMLSARQNLEDAKGLFEKMFDVHQLEKLIRAEPEATPLSLDPISGQAVVNVKVWVDIKCYEAWVGDIVKNVSSMATRKFECVDIDLEKMVRGRNSSIQLHPNYQERAFKRMPDDATIAILVNPRTFETFGAVLDKEKAECLFSSIPVRTARLRVRLIDKDGETITVREEDVGFKNGYGWGDDAAAFVCRGFGQVWVMPFFFFGPHDGFYKLDVDMYESSTIPVAMGKLEETDVRRLDKVSVEIFLVDPMQNRRGW